jgi:predicted CopG family antitoxin
VPYFLPHPLIGQGSGNNFRLAGMMSTANSSIVYNSVTIGMSVKTLRHITVDEGNYLALKRLGSAGDSFNDVISKLLKTAITTEKEIEKEEKVSCVPSMVSSPEGRKKAVQPPMTQERSET